MVEVERHGQKWIVLYDGLWEGLFETFEAADLYACMLIERIRAVKAEG